MYIWESEAAGGMEYPFVRGYLSGAVGYIRKNKTIRQDTKIYLSHINQCHTAPHEKLQGIMTDAKPEYQIVVAYDGLEIPISRDGK